MPALAVVLSACYSIPRLDRNVAREVTKTAARDEIVSTGAVADARARIDESAAAAITNVDLNLTSALQLAAQYGRDLQAKREKLYIDTLSLYGTRREYEITYGGTIQYILNRHESGDDENTQGHLELARKLPTGGRVGLTGDASRQDNHPDQGEDTTRYASSGRIRIDQPLLAGAGYEPGYGPLIQARHDYVYAVRDFVLAREDLAIQVMRDYFALVRSKRVLENTRKNVEQFTFLRERSEALFQVSRAPAIDVLRSQQEELGAINRLQTAEESYTIQASRFLVSLGLPATAKAKVAEDVPPMHEVAESEEQSIALGLERRLDLITTSDRREDAERQWRIAHRAMLPELSAFGEAELESHDAPSWSGQTYDESESAGLELQLPIDKRGERDALRRAAIARDAADRAWRDKRDSVRLEIAENFSNLRALRTSVDIEARNIDVAERRARNASLRFRNGELSNRDVIEAENDLLNARNAWIQALLDYEVQRVQLLRNVGLLDVAEDGQLIELTPPVEVAP